MTNDTREAIVSEIMAEFSQVVAAAKRRWARFADESQPELKGAGMIILQTIIRQGPITATGIGSVLDIDKATISRKLAKLRELGLVQATLAESDKRVTLLTASAGAQEMMDEMHAKTAVDYKTRLAEWSATDLAQLRSSLHRFNESAELLTGQGPAHRCSREEAAG